MKKGVLLVVLNIMCAATVAAQEPVSNTQQEQQLDEVTIEQARPGTMLMQGSLGQMEVINRAGLTKMACCTLSQSFENSATTQTSYSDAVTGARQIQLLGLSGIYTQTLAENVPILRGLGYTYGWDNTPASWLDGISISKGASSVVNGIEGITGQLNLDFAKPNQGQPVYIDLYTDQFMHHEINSILRHAFSPKLFSALFLHTTQTTMPNRWHSVMDRNNDDFMDMPKVRNYNIYNRWLYADEEYGVQSRFDVRLVYDRRKAGQMHGDSIGFPYDPTGQTIIIGNDKFFSPYKVDIVNHDLHLSNKTGIAIGNKEGQSLGIINSLTRHSMDAIYGFRQLHGKEYTYAGNLIWNSYIGRPAHAYQAGLSLDFDHIRLEYLEQGIVATYDRTRRMTSNTYERRTGAFAEYTNTAVKNLTFMVGMRLDRYSLSGTDKHWLFTPRMNIKYTPFSWLTARLSAGRGYRTAHPLTDQIGQMATSRQYAFLPQQPELEKAWNVGGNLIFTFPTWNGYEATLSLDYYRVMFQNRVVADLDAAPGYVYFYNMHQHSHIDTWQADLSMPLAKGLTLFTAFKYTDQRLAQQRFKQVTVPSGPNGITTFNEATNDTYATSQPLVSRYKGLFNLQYATGMRRWVFDATLQLNGTCRIPTHMVNLAPTGNMPATVDGRSKRYTLLFAQVTRRFRNIEMYIGGENLLDYRQKDPILGADDPYGKFFDASLVWGPITGRKVYCGMRINIGKFI